ncbi:MAG: DUF4932 domain-containing protein [Candidatus Brocadiia bacterium]
MKRIALMAVLLVSFGAAVARAENPGLNISVDPRIELLLTVQSLSNYARKTSVIHSFQTDYRKDLDKYFTPFKSEEAVSLFDEMASQGFAYDAPPTAMLYLSEPPDLKVAKPFPADVLKRVGGAKKMDAFVESMRAFAVKTKFMDFYNAHADAYKKMTDEVRALLDADEYVARLEKYYGSKQHSYNIMLMPISGHGFGPRIALPDGTFDLYCICGSVGEMDGQPSFGTKKDFQNFTIHEFSHSFVNALTTKNLAEVNKYQILFEPIASNMAKQAYPQWEICVNEHIVRAVTARLCFLKFGEEGLKESIAYEKARSFAYIEHLIELLKEYEAARDKYPTFADFYPRIIDKFRELAEKAPKKLQKPFTGPINSVFVDKIAVIMPTNEEDDEALVKIIDYATQIHDQFFGGGLLLDDDSALKEDLSDYNIIVYGTPKGNTWLAKYFSQLPIQVTADKIVADTEYKGSGLKLITCWPNPANPKKGVVIYTAQRAADIPGINEVFHGPTDYVIFEDTKNVLKTGNFVKTDGVWTIK